MPIKRKILPQRTTWRVSPLMRDSLSSTSLWQWLDWSPTIPNIIVRSTSMRGYSRKTEHLNYLIESTVVLVITQMDAPPRWKGRLTWKMEERVVLSRSAVLGRKGSRWRAALRRSSPLLANPYSTRGKVSLMNSPSSSSIIIRLLMRLSRSMITSFRPMNQSHQASKTSCHLLKTMKLSKPRSQSSRVSLFHKGPLSWMDSNSNRQQINNRSTLTSMRTSTCNSMGRSRCLTSWRITTIMTTTSSKKWRTTRDATCIPTMVGVRAKKTSLTMAKTSRGIYSSIGRRSNRSMTSWRISLG